MIHNSVTFSCDKFGNLNFFAPYMFHILFSSYFTLWLHKSLYLVGDLNLYLCRTYILGGYLFLVTFFWWLLFFGYHYFIVTTIWGQAGTKTPPQ